MSLGGRVARLLLVVFFVTLGTFAFLDALPGDPVDALLPPGATDAQREAVTEEYGLDEPFFQRYLSWLGDALTGDLGRSSSSGQPVSEALRERFPVSLELALGSMAVALLVAIPVGVYCGYRPGRPFDQVTTWLTSALLAVPAFLLAVLVLYVFAVELGWFPITGWQPWSAGPSAHLERMVLPIVVLAADQAVLFIRVLRNDMMATLQEDYTLAARARGLTTRRVLFAHALRPSMFSLVTVLGVSFGRLLGGTVIIESIFGIPGLGSYLIDSISNRDYVAVQGVVLVVAVSYVLINTLVDAVYPLLDPRVRVQRA